MTKTEPLILASGSAIRAAILKSHGIDFTAIKPDVDESVIKAEGEKTGADLETIAMQLAEAKCLAVAKNNPGFTVGSDQILEFEGEAFDKPRDLAEAHNRLTAMAGKTHSLINATVLALDGEIIWRNLERPKLTLRSMAADEIDRYLDAVGEKVLTSVGAYQVETDDGAALFEHIGGDWFAVQGLAVYPLLDELRQRGFFGAEWKNPEPIKAGVVGSPISHSLSPHIHNEWARRSHVKGEYRAIEIAPNYEAFALAMDDLRAQGFAGVNVTIPHKENALRYAAQRSETAQSVGAANMLTFTGKNAVADNSDAAGFLGALKENMPPDQQLRNAVVLGAGGAARGIVVALHEAGCERIRIANRTRQKADLLADEFGLDVIEWDDRSNALATCDLLVNTTSLGMTGEPPLEIDLSTLPSQAVVFDIVYAPVETPLLRAARENGHSIVNGLEMLMHQAVPGFRAWFGGRPYQVMPQVDDDLRALLLDELKKRGG